MKSNIFSITSIYLFLTIFIPISLLISSGASLATEILISIFFLITCFHLNNFDWLKNKYFLLLLIVWFFLLLNLLFSQNFNLSLARNIFFFKNIFFVFAINFIFRKEKNLNTIFLFYLIIVNIVCFDIFFEYFNGKNILGFQSEYGGRIASFLGKELKIGAFMLGFAFISLGYYFEKYINKSIKLKVFGIFLILIFYLSLLLTGERANFLRGAIIILLFISLQDAKVFKYKKSFLIVIILTPIFVYFFFDKIKSRINSIIFPVINIGIIETYKETQHGAHFDTAIKIFEKNILFGVGNKNFREECQKDVYINNDYARTAQRCSTHPHQIYYELLSEHGLIGTISLLAVIFYSLFNGIKIYLLSKNSIHLASILFVFTQFLPVIPSGSFFTTWGSTIFWLNFSILIFYNNKSNYK
jgi:O-antigen ligase